MIEIKHLEKAYPNATPLKDVNCVINDGDVITVIGPSGTGKSTLLRMINLLEKPTAGEIYVDGTEIVNSQVDETEVHKKIGMVFQSFNLYPHVSTIENIMLPQMHILKRDKQEAYDRAAELLKTVGLYEKRFNFPDELSGGQKQRVAIARTLAMDTNIILFDEPTSALDPSMVGEVEAVIKNLSTTGKTLMIVTHDMNFARNVSNRIFYMDEGVIYEDGTPEQIFDNPKREKTQNFINKVKKEEFVLDSKYFDFLGCVTKINEFCFKNHIDYKPTSKLVSLFEETVAVNLLPHMTDSDKAKIKITYSEKKSSIELEILYTGQPFDLVMDGDELAKALIEKKASDISYEKIDEDGFTNRLKLVL